MNQQYLSAISLLPDFIASILQTIDKSIANRVTEIRLRSGKPLSLTLNNGIIYPHLNGYSLLPQQCSVIITPDSINDTFHKLCNNSVYSHEEEIAQGFLILKGGHRAGVCGKVIKKSNGTSWITDISSINIRVAHEIIGVADTVYGQTYNFNGLLICGPPGSGKTTLLRDYIRTASQRGERIALIDCRGEIAAVKNSLCGLDVGINTDVITGGQKAQGIEQALRVLSPEIIAFDEIGTEEELKNICDCFNSGVKIITTFHCDSIKELLLRNKSLPILETGVFSHFVFLDKFYRTCVYKEGELESEDNRGSGDNNFLHSMRNGLCVKAL